MTKREREIIALIADGMSNKEIAQHLNIATHTVKSHVHNIMEKLALHSRLQIAKYTHNKETSEPLGFATASSLNYSFKRINSFFILLGYSRLNKS